VGNDVVVDREVASLAQTSFCMEFCFICATEKKRRKGKKNTLLYDHGVNGIG